MKTYLKKLDHLTPDADHLFQIRDEKEAKLLPVEQGIQFHHTVAQLLFVCMRAVQDIQTVIAFLSTRVKAPNEDDWVKLKRVMKYLNGTRNLELRLCQNNLGIIHWFVDALYAIQLDCKGHTGLMLT